MDNFIYHPRDAVNRFFYTHQETIGDYDKLIDLLDTYPQVEGNHLRYLIAGSWAIELMSGQKMIHDDIDIITITDPPFYVDDAVTKEEHCDGVIPLKQGYFDSLLKIINCENVDGRKIYLPDLNIQLCLKLIGELKRPLSERAVSQLRIILSLYNKINLNQIQQEIMEIYLCCLPDELDISLLTEQTINAISMYKSSEKKAVFLFKRIHKRINMALHQKFKTDAN